MVVRRDPAQLGFAREEPRLDRPRRSKDGQASKIDYANVEASPASTLQLPKHSATADAVNVSRPRRLYAPNNARLRGVRCHTQIVDSTTATLPPAMLNLLTLPLHLLKGSWSLLKLLISGLHEFSVRLDHASTEMLKASEQMLQKERARRLRNESNASGNTGHTQRSLAPHSSTTSNTAETTRRESHRKPLGNAAENEPWAAGKRRSGPPATDALPSWARVSGRPALESKLDATEAKSARSAFSRVPPPVRRPRTLQGNAGPTHRQAVVDAVRSGSRPRATRDVLGPVRLVLFDLDGTLLRTTDLERFRGRAHLGPQPTSYIEALSEAFHRDASRWIYSHRDLSALIAACPEVKFGVFTRSPRAYAVHLLEAAYPGLRWNVIIAFEDVRRSKPYGEGILQAMRVTGVSDLQSVVMVGDDVVDISAAYNAGCLAFLETGGWTEQNRFALEKVPDARVKGPKSLLHAIHSLPERLPALESALAGPDSAPTSRRFDPVIHEGLLGKRLVVHVAGRFFVDNLDLTARRVLHDATSSILDNKSSIRFPDSWLNVLISFIQLSLTHLDEVLVTVVPAKPGRPPRLEELLAQVERITPQGTRNRCEFAAGLLAYSDSAESHSGKHLNKEQRLANAMANLSVAAPNTLRGRDVIVFDDVVTSGATLIATEAKLLDAGARSVTCAAMAKSVRFS